MGRKQQREKRALAGLKNENFKSKSSPSFVRFRESRKESTNLGRVLPRRHTKRKELHAQLTRELGLPLDTKFIFRWSSADCDEAESREKIVIYYGTTVVINKKDMSLVLAVRCTPFAEMSPEFRSSLDHAISHPFLQARARGKCLTNHSVRALIVALLFWGWLGACGWRGGCDTGKSLGHYALSAFSSAKEERVDEDRVRMAEFHKVRDFWAERFSTLCFFAFESNRELATRANVPGFDQLEWQHTPNGSVFASNLVVTCDEFHNTTHVDFDHTRYAFGITCNVRRISGVPYEIATSGSKARIMGGAFTIDEFGVEVDPERVDGTSELVWDTRVPHRTKPSITIDGEGHRIRPEKSAITRFGSSCQVSESLVKRIDLLEKQQGNMSTEEWMVHRESRVKSYSEEIARKLMRLQDARADREGSN